MQDKTKVCKDCGKEFIFTVGEQEFYKEKGFTNEPVRCKECRDKRKAEKCQNRIFILFFLINFFFKLKYFVFIIRNYFNNIIIFV